MLVKRKIDGHLAHHGVKGQHWGVRRYQNADGTLTAAGRKKYLNEDGSFNKKGDKYVEKVKKKAIKGLTDDLYKAKNDDDWFKSVTKVNNTLMNLTGQRVSSVEMWSSNPKVVKTVNLSFDVPMAKVTDSKEKNTFRNRYALTTENSNIDSSLKKKKK